MNTRTVPEPHPITVQELAAANRALLRGQKAVSTARLRLAHAEARHRDAREHLANLLRCAYHDARRVLAHNGQPSATLAALDDALDIVTDADPSDGP